MTMRAMLSACAVMIPAVGHAQSAERLINAAIDRESSESKAYVTKSLRTRIVKEYRANADKTKSRPGAGGHQTHYHHHYGGGGFHLFLEAYPTIHLSVTPVPPSDYTVSINGENCPATEQGIYKVPEGPTRVDVLRRDKPPCNWSGPMEDGQTQEVSCKF